ncbi:MAG: type II toxin-antitoxin system RelE/ParE family toxin [Geminicoccaceae bacterium]
MKVRWTDPAQTDLFEILDYIARDNPGAAERVERRLVNAVASLAQQPRRGRPGRIEGTRELVIPRLPYIVIYRLVERPLRTVGEVAVMRVLHGARRWPANGG